jgi:hypothetical protein
MLNLAADLLDKSARDRMARQEACMNHSIYSADRSTHVKIVVVALIAGIAVAGQYLGSKAPMGIHPDRASSKPASR